MDLENLSPIGEKVLKNKLFQKHSKELKGLSKTDKEHLFVKQKSTWEYLLLPNERLKLQKEIEKAEQRNLKEVSKKKTT